MFAGQQSDAKSKHLNKLLWSMILMLMILMPMILTPIIIIMIIINSRL